MHKMQSYTCPFHYRYIFSAVVIVLLIRFISFPKYYSPRPPLTGQEYHLKDNPPEPTEKPYSEKHGRWCDAFQGSDNVVVTVKTGATEISEKVPMQMVTALQCAPNAVVFSDMAQTIGDYQIHDALAAIPASVKDGNSDFDIYREQEKLRGSGLISKVLKGHKDPRDENALAAWTLDKYKNLHMYEEAWEMYPNRNWYLHLDADSYVIWSSLLAWMARLDPTKELFLGSLSYIVGKPFAHGGSGILLSRAAMENFAVTHNGTAARWDHQMHENCCGDWVFGQVMHEYGVDVSNSWPTINGETPATIPFGKEYWCQPMVTLHHVSPEQMQQLATFERQRANPTVCTWIFIKFNTQSSLIHCCSTGATTLQRAVHRSRFRYSTH
jgi:hypothetical protein